MAIIFPTLEDQEKLVQFAMCPIGCSSEDVEILKATCTTLVADTQLIGNFILKPHAFFSTDTRRSHLASDAAILPIHYHIGGMPENYGFRQNSTSFFSDLFYNTRDRFRTHEALLRSLQSRLRRGKDALTSLNEQYNYAFTVVTVGKGGRVGIMKGETCRAESNVHAQSVPVVELTSEKSHSNIASLSSEFGESRGGGRRVHVVFMMFIQTFDVFIQWVTNLVGVLDGEGTIPSPGTYVMYDQPQKCSEKYHDNTNNEDEMGMMPKSSPVPLPHVTDVTSAPQSHQQGAGNSPESSCSAVTASSTQTRRARTIRVSRYELHDVDSVFLFFASQANQFYLQECTSYDPRLQCRLLLPAYYSSLSEIIRNIKLEIERLDKLGVSLARERSNDVTIVFRPTICEFRHLQNSLRLYLSFCVAEDDLTAFQYYRMQYNKCVVEAGEVMETLRQLRRPSAYETGANSRVTSTVSDIITNTDFGQTPEERGAIRAGFESFWRVRECVLKLYDSLVRDIKEKNRTHRYRLSAPLSSLLTSDASGAKKSGNFMQWTLSKVSAWTQFVTCGVELPYVASSAEYDDEGFLLSTHSPLYESKAELLCLVQRMVTAVEAQATVLERDYPGAFYRDLKGKWSQQASNVMHYLESVSVVFSRPT